MKLRRGYFRAGRNVSGRAHPPSSYRSSYVECGVRLGGRMRSVSVSFDSQPHSVDHSKLVQENLERKIELLSKAKS